MPEEFGRYQLIELIGRGGMGEVYRAQDTVRDRTVALKVLPDYLAGDESFESRFRRESRMAAKLNEPHIIPIHDFGEIDGRLFIDMRLVEGQDLGSVLRTRGTLPVDVAVDLVAQTASALDAAHASGLVHRDVKPSNILLTGLTDELDTVPFAYLVDFGIARSSAQEGTALTATTATVGTVAYMSPERISGSASDLRTDVYALACVLYESLTGRKPFEGEMFAQMYAHMNTPPPRASERRTEVPALLDDVIVQGMAKNPDDRYLSAGALASAARSAVRDAARTETVRGRAADFGALPTAPSGAPAGTRSGPSAPHGPPPQNTPLLGPPPQGPPPQGPPPQGPPPQGSPPQGPPPPRGDANSGVWTPPPPPRTGPAAPPLTPVLPAPRSAAGRSRRTALIAAIVVLVVALGAAVAFVATRGGGGSSANGRGSGAPSTSGARTSRVSTSGSSAAPVLSTGSAGTPEVSWAHFGAFSKLLGTSNRDTAAAFNGGSCTLAAAGAADAKLGIRDEVTCTYSGSPQQVTVARFASAAQLQTYLDTRVDGGYGEFVWTTSAQPSGLTIVTPRSGSGPSSLTSSICGLPTYLVQVSAPDRTQVSTDDLNSDTWDKATFPDAVPPACDSQFRAARIGGSTAPSAGPAKGVLTMTDAVIEALARQGDPSLPIVQVPTQSSVQAIAVGQKGSVTFWSETDNTLQRVGRSTYPYSTSLGAPEATAIGAVLTGMDDATFVVRGTFSGDGSGNAVAYTNGSKGWGAIKAQSDGSLKPSGDGVGIGGIGLGDDFALVGGRLQTFDCSSQLPVAQCGGNDRVIKYWTWKKTKFVQTGSAGRTR